VDPGENLHEAAIRECKEEAGCDVKLTGLLQFQYSPSRRKHVRLRVIFLAELVDPSQTPKSLPDYESMGAIWVDMEAIEQLQFDRMLRGDEPYVWSEYLLKGGAVHPLSVLGKEFS
jgi:8-oxo-dGTP pyrophosphatase MutT (NUDIX family)